MAIKTNRQATSVGADTDLVDLKGKHEEHGKSNLGKIEILQK